MESSNQQAALPGPVGTAFIAEVKEHLVALGWQAVDGTAVASKTYKTAVGPKVAFVYVADYGPTEENVQLNGDYVSEGNNVLACGVSIPKAAVGDSLAALVKKFAVNADRAVDESYARRLWLRGFSAQ